MKINLRLPKAHPAQQQVLDSTARFRVLMAGRRFGKSLIVQWECIERMLCKESIAYITPDFSLAKDFFDEMVELLPSTLIYTANKTRLRIKLITGGVIRFYSGMALQRMRGKKFNCCVVDEAAFIPDLENAWSKVIRPTLSDYVGSAIFISTPNGLDYFNKIYQKGLQSKDGYESFHFTSYDNPYLLHSEIEAAKAELPIAVFNQEYMAVPLSDQNNPFSTFIDSNILPTLSNKPVVVYGIDVAKYNDWTVVVGLTEDGSMAYFDRFQLSWTDTINRLKSTLNNKILKVIDRTGVGDVIVEQLQNTLQNVEGFLFTTTSKNTIVFELIKDVELGNVKYNQITADEMKTFQYKRNATTGHLSFNAKSGYHDDCIAALAMANHHRKFVKANANWRLYKV